MYQAHWQLTEKPFENTPDPRFLYYSPKHEEALARLNYAISERKGAALLTGEFGSGKTVLSRALEGLLDNTKYKMVFITNSQLPAFDFLVGIAKQLGAQQIPERKIDLLDLINDMLRRNVNIGKDTIVVIDEAQLIEDKDIFEEIRLLLNFQLNDRFLMTLVLLGQPELRERVNAIPQLRQRMGVRYHLDALSEEETKQYVLHRLKVAGREASLFKPEAVHLVYEQSKGLPREINNLCDMSLFLGFAKKLSTIDEAIVREVVKDYEG